MTMTTAEIATVIGVAISFGLLWFRMGRFIGRVDGVGESVKRISTNVSRLFKLHDERGRQCAEHGERLAGLEQSQENGERRLERLEESSK